MLPLLLLLLVLPPPVPHLKSLNDSHASDTPPSLFFFYCLNQRASKGNTGACRDKGSGVLACSQRVRTPVRLCALALVTFKYFSGAEIL